MSLKVGIADLAQRKCKINNEVTNANFVLHKMNYSHFTKNQKIDNDLAKNKRNSTSNSLVTGFCTLVSRNPAEPIPR